MPSLVVHYFYDAIIIFMIAVKRQLIENPEANKHSYGHTYGQATYINKRRGLVFKKISPGDLEIIFYHAPLFKSKFKSQKPFGIFFYFLIFNLFSRRNAYRKLR